MRRGTMLVLGLLLASTAMPQTADARPLLLKVLRGMTPFGAIVGAPRHSRRVASHHRQRRAIASRSRPRPATIAAAPAAAVAGAAAVTAATADATAPPPDAAKVQAAAPDTTGSAPVDNPPARNPAIQETPAQNVTAAVPLPTPAPPQRNAALEVGGDEPQSSISTSAQAPPVRAIARLGTVGPLAWPSAYEDVVGFTLWPKEYGERLRVHGIGDVLSTALAPSSSLAARTRQTRADEPNSAPVTSVCGSVDLTATDWPIAQITSAIDLNDAQRRALDQLKTALSDAVSSIKSTCRDDANLGPVERLRVMQSLLWAVHDAAHLIRAPLAKFYDSLSDDQKQKFAAPAQPQAGGRAVSRADMARMCDLPASTEAVMRQIEQNLRPTKAQRASLEGLQKKAFEMGQFLLASCLKPVPATPAERLDAAADRLTAVIFAVSNVNMALNDFTSQLNDEQKTKLDSLVR
jgi:LTXXQ motif family protein